MGSRFVSWSQQTILLLLLAVSLSATLCSCQEQSSTSNIVTTYLDNDASSSTDQQRRKQQEQSFDLYNIKPFAVHITSPSLAAQQQTQHAQHLSTTSLGYTLKAVTEKYLREFIDASILHDNDPAQASPLDQVERVDLQVAVATAGSQRKRLLQRTNRHLQDSTDGSSGIVGRMYGSAAFVSSQTPPPLEEAEAFLQDLVDQAFGTPNNLQLYQERLEASGEPHFAEITSLTVTTNLDDSSFSPAPGDSVGAPNDGGGGGGGWSALQISFLSILFVLLFSGMAVLFIRMRHYSVHNHDISKHDPYSDERSAHQPPLPPSSHDFYGSRNLACMDEQRHASMHSMSSSSSPRHYNQGEPTLLQRFYQAAFSAQEPSSSYNDGVMHDQQRLHHSSYVVGRSHSVFHQEEEEDAVDHHIHRSGPYMPTEGGTLASWVRSISAPFTNNSSLSSSSPRRGQEEQIQFMVEHNGKPFVYRDFPRHDGTPCLIYNSDSPASSDHPYGQQQDFASTIWATSQQTASSSSNSPSSSSPPHSKSFVNSREAEEEDDEEEPVDSFVDRLEQLMVVRHEQYQERCAMEWQKSHRAARRRLSSGDGEQQHRVLSIQEAEAALDDFLEVNLDTPVKGETKQRDGEYETAAMVSPTADGHNGCGGDKLMSTPPAKTSSLSYDHVLTDEKQIDEAMRAQQYQQRRQVSWDEEDPTITGVMT